MVRMARSMASEPPTVTKISLLGSYSTLILRFRYLEISKRSSERPAFAV